MFLTLPDRSGPKRLPCRHCGHCGLGQPNQVAPWTWQWKHCILCVRQSPKRGKPQHSHPLWRLDTCTSKRELLTRPALEQPRHALMWLPLCPPLLCLREHPKSAINKQQA
ncbi:hypothetical protein V8G54_022202 [Vigna mungo]|uniref:Uncharacterized protein n=1 Tax=Vigna mungo TaxID=3915 RepID=A0AAQ3NH22_VIGMU